MRRRGPCEEPDGRRCEHQAHADVILRDLSFVVVVKA
jgi:hypothetical protein